MQRFTLSRRAMGRGALGLVLAAFATGASATLRRRFLFLHAEGGWDPLCAFAPLFDAPHIDMEPAAVPLSIAGFSLVDGPDRPSVRAFFERWGAATLLLHGLSTRSVNHETCQAVALTGSGGDSRADWATLLAAADAPSFYLPHVVLNGPSFAGSHSIVVSRAEGLIESAVDGSILELADTPLAQPSLDARALVDDRLAARALQLANASYPDALARSRALAGASELVHFPPAYDFRARALNAIRLLADGVSRCASVSTDFVWDTHIDNGEQPYLFETLFADLHAILEAIAATPTLADDTVVVVLSEMARTPAYNSTQGRDHWPYTSALAIGPGITGGRTVGGYDDLYTGIGIDPATGELDPSRPGIDARDLGATLLALGDVDPAPVLPGAQILGGVLA